MNRRQLLLGGIAGLAASRWNFTTLCGAPFPPAGAATRGILGENRWDEVIDRGLGWIANQQSRLGHWPDSNYPTAMAALAGMALLCSGSTTTQGPYSSNIRDAVEYLIDKSRANGLIGDPQRDNRYTYGHGFSMLFLSQVLGEEEHEERREVLMDVLERAVEFSVNAQTDEGGWGYISAAEGTGFDEGSTTVTQVQGLRSCRNAGIPVPMGCIESAKEYIYKCKNDDGGISYSSQNLGVSRPAITAAALAALYNAGDYDSEYVPQMRDYTRERLHNVSAVRDFGHFQYTYLYYAQVVYRESREAWEPFRDQLYDKLSETQLADGSWAGDVSPIYVTSCNLIILQLDKAYLPIYQR